MDAKEAKEIIKAGFQWANWTEQQRQAFKFAYDCIEKVENWKAGTPEPVKVHQAIEVRESRHVDEGTMGFSDWTTVYEDFDKFVNRVQEKWNTRKDVEVFDIRYPGGNTAVIIYKEL